MAWRIVHSENVMKGRSHCAVCGHQLATSDLIPIVSYLALRGKCRYCGEKISPRYVVVEIMLALAFILALWQLGITVEALELCVLSCILLALSLVDLEIYQIPNRFIIAGIVWWAVLIPFRGSVTYSLLSGLVGGVAIGGVMLLLTFVFDKITGKEGLGGGDIKLFFMTGLFLGPLTGLLNLIIACIVGIGFSLFMKKKKIPFGPAISMAVYISMLAGPGVVEWYLSLF
ncbi:MAG: prepilin peptidase [Clostridiales bacterium]|nr:prepilin peptidase [Clostridiales bacterium]